MADLPPAPGSNDDTGDDTGVGPGRGSTRRRPRWVMVFGIILVKLGIIALILVLPFGLAISLGATHGVALLVLLVVAAVTLLVYKLRGRTLHPARSHRPPCGHRFVLGCIGAHQAQDRREVASETHGNGRYESRCRSEASFAPSSSAL
jgi:hypothetical protein